MDGWMNGWMDGCESFLLGKENERTEPPSKKSPLSIYTVSAAANRKRLRLSPIGWHASLSSSRGPRPLVHEELLHATVFCVSPTELQLEFCTDLHLSVHKFTHFGLPNIPSELLFSEIFFSCSLGVGFFLFLGFEVQRWQQLWRLAPWAPLWCRGPWHWRQVKVWVRRVRRRGWVLLLCLWGGGSRLESVMAVEWRWWRRMW